MGYYIQRPSELTEVTHPSKTKALITTMLTPQTDTEALAIDDMDVNTPVETNATTPIETEVVALSSIESSVPTDEWFLGGSMDYSVLTAYVDHVTF